MSIAFEHYPFSHSLLALMLWGPLLGFFHFVRRHDLATAAVLVALVASHWFLDAIVHRPDLPLAPGDPVRVGLGLWNSTAATLAVESSLFAGGLMLYQRATRRLGVRRWPLALYAVLLAGIFVALSLAPPPPNVQAIAWAGQSQWLLVALAWWVDRAPARVALSPA
ncbi:MAG: hypothetical protein NZL99_04060 [Burkholderiaceae bacterium]|nr:hypothetical protein [Burkholderiaceae bacterium]